MPRERDAMLADSPFIDSLLGSLHEHTLFGALIWLLVLASVIGLLVNLFRG